MTVPSAIRAAIRLLLGWLCACHRDRRDRQLLASLDPRMLRDLGLDRRAVEGDSTQDFWR
jgi:uncharacterized protein YjiS (DUF1127 family)